MIPRKNLSIDLLNHLNRFNDICIDILLWIVSNKTVIILVVQVILLKKRVRNGRDSKRILIYY